MILAAEMRSKASALHIVAGAIDAMLQSAAVASDILAAHGATAGTDVTGFGLLGHLNEMLTASRPMPVSTPPRSPRSTARSPSSSKASPVHCTSATCRRSPLSKTPTRIPPLAKLLIDPQTAGGLLAGVPAEARGAVLAELQRRGYRAAEIGVVMAQSGASPVVRLDPCSPRRRRSARAMKLPSVDRVLVAAPRLIAEYGRSLVLDAVRVAIAERRGRTGRRNPEHRRRR